MQQLKQILKKFTVAIIFLVVVFGAFVGGFFMGSNQKTILVQSPDNILKGDFSVFWEATQLIKDKFVNIKDVKDQALIYGAIKGSLAALGDPYSVFFNPSDAEKFQQDINGAFGGIGAEIGIKNNQLVIVSPLKGNPAEAAGLQANDKILKINDKDTTDVAVDEAVKLIRGAPDTEVRLLIYRDDWKAPKEFKIMRKVIVIPTLDMTIKNGNVAYIQLYNFDANVPNLFYQAVLSALTQGAKGVVIDLRNNPGGFLDVATNLGGWFFKRGDVIVREHFRSGMEEATRAEGNAALADVPVVVLVNGGSASASEILAGALRDNRHAKLIGEKTFGKGSVQEIDSLKDGSSIKVSIAEWLTPNGTHINKIGIEPDITIKITDDDAAKKHDPQLAKALEVIGKEIAAH